jgi:hypothetical protein
MPRLDDPVPLVERAEAHALEHPECAGLIRELIDRVEAVQRTVRRIADSTWDDDLGW